MTTFAAVLSTQLTRDPGRPLVTFYDHDSGERTELSVTTYANWVAKTASLLAEELDLERGQRLLVDLPPHWLGPVFLGAAWTLGLAVVWEEPADAVVCGPDGVDRWAHRVGDLPVLGCSLRPLGVRFAEPLPTGVLDMGVEVWSQPDAFTAWDPPTGDDGAVPGLTQEQMWKAAADGSLLTDGGRLLTTKNPTSPSGLSVFAEPLLKGGSVVLVAHPDAERLAATGDAERVTVTDH